MEIILYDCHWNEKKTTPQLPPLLPKRFYQPLGWGLMAISLAVFLLTAGPILVTEILYRLEKKSEVQSQAIVPAIISPEPANAEKEAASWGVSANFSIVIPKIQAKAEIIANVNAGKETEYREALKSGVAHAAGTSFPGQGGTIYLFAHSTDSPVNISRYNAVFYLIKELEAGDQIIVFYSGQKFIYQVTEKLITSASDTAWLTQSSPEEKLILQTCWPPGTSQKRLLIICQPVFDHQ